MRKGAISLMTQVIFATVLVVAVLIFIWNTLIVPSVVSYGNEHAVLTAQSLSTSINALSREDRGSVYKELGLPWDISVFHDGDEAYISVKHEKIKSGDILLISDAEDFSETNIDNIYVVKEPGKKPALQLSPPSWSSTDKLPGGGTKGTW